MTLSVGGREIHLYVPHNYPPIQERPIRLEGMLGNLEKILHPMILYHSMVFV